MYASSIPNATVSSTTQLGWSAQTGMLICTHGECTPTTMDHVEQTYGPKLFHAAMSNPMQWIDVPASADPFAEHNATIERCDALFAELQQQEAMDKQRAETMAYLMLALLTPAA